MRLIVFLTIVIIVSSCGAKNPDERLLFFSTRMVMSMDSLVKVEDDSLYQGLFSDHFNERTDTIKFNQKEIYVSYLSVVNGCADYSGELQFKGDSILLKLENKRDYVCTEQRCDRVIFRIRNDGDRKYIIKKW
jgi:hypothetical protein